MGAIEDLEYSTREIKLQAGDALVVYSDGITDALDTQGQMFTRDRWQELLAQSAQQERLHASELARQVLEFTAEAAQYDDISLLVVNRLQGGPEI